MKASTREWVAKAEEDFVVATTLARPRKKPLWTEAKRALETCKAFRREARLALGLPKR